MAKQVSITDLRDEKKQLREAQNTIINKAKAETRGLNDEEKRTFEANNLRMREIDLEISEREDELRSQRYEKLTQTEKRGVSLQRAIAAKLQGKAMEDPEARACERGATLMSGIETDANSLLIPFETRAVVSASAASTYGGVTTEDTDVVLPLQNNLVAAQAGATIITGLRGNVRVPAMSAVTVAWDAENDAASDGGSAPTTAKTFSPKRLCAYVDISKQLLIQENQSFEAIIRKLIADAVAQKLENTAFGTGHGSDAPDGLFYDPINATTPYIRKATVGWAEFVGMETEVNTAGGLKDSLAYILHPALWGAAKTKAKEATTGAGGLIIDGSNPLLNGYKCFNTANMASGLDTSSTSTPATNGYGAIFGNWSDFHMLNWGALDITVDPYSQATAGKVRLVVNSYWDFGAIRRGSFAFSAIKLA